MHAPANNGIYVSHDARSKGGEICRRDAILEAATQAFAHQGFAGARTNAIARDAAVNISLLYYYFETKEKLYAAVLERIFVEWAGRVVPVLKKGSSPSEKITAYVEAYFDFIAESPARPRLVHQEMMQVGGVGAARLIRLVQKYVRPVHQMLLEILQAGEKAGEFRHVQPDFIHSINAIIVSYFTNSVFIQVITGSAPLTVQKIAARRRSVLDTLVATLFISGVKDKLPRKAGKR